MEVQTEGNLKHYRLQRGRKKRKTPKLTFSLSYALIAGVFSTALPSANTHWIPIPFVELFVVKMLIPNALVQLQCTCSKASYTVTSLRCLCWMAPEHPRMWNSQGRRSEAPSVFWLTNKYAPRVITYRRQLKRTCAENSSKKHYLNNPNLYSIDLNGIYIHPFLCF
jgi:hypothetical protein